MEWWVSIRDRDNSSAYACRWRADTRLQATLGVLERPPSHILQLMLRRRYPLFVRVEPTDESKERPVGTLWK